MRGGDSDEESVSSISSINSFGSGSNISERGRGPPGAPGSHPSSPVASLNQKQAFARRAPARRKPSYSAEFSNARANLDIDEESDEDV